MKLAKLSLAAIVAVGAMTTFANATPLEEAIKGVELNGFLRYRYYNEDNKNDNAGTDKHRYTGVLDFTVPVDENLKAGLVLRYEGSDFAQDTGVSKHGLAVQNAFFLYSIDGFSLKAGKIPVFSPWTDSSYTGKSGNGALALYTGVPGWTFGAGAFVNTDLDLTARGLKTVAGKTVASEISELDIGKENLYALAALGAFGPVNLQVWAASMERVFDYSVFLDAQFEMSGFTAQLQANMLKLDERTKSLFKDDSGMYFGGKLGYAIDGFSAEVGYTKNDKDQPIYTLSQDDSEGFIWFGEQLGGQVANTADASTLFINLGYEMDQFSVGAGYGYADAYKGVQKANSDKLGSEWEVTAGYKYSKNFKLSAYYSSLDMENDADSNDEIKFEAKYSF